MIKPEVCIPILNRLDTWRKCSMAKKAKTESVLSKETRLKAAANSAAEAAKAAAEKVAAPIVVTPKAERPKKVKKARYVREQTEKRPEKKAPPLREQSSTARGKIMTKNLAYHPDDPALGPKRP